MTAETFSSAPRDNNQPSNVTNVSLMYDGGISIESYSAGEGIEMLHPWWTTSNL